jgi:hypothetical protein
MAFYLPINAGLSQFEIPRAEKVRIISKRVHSFKQTRVSDAAVRILK